MAQLTVIVDGSIDVLWLNLVNDVQDGDYVRLSLTNRIYCSKRIEFISLQV